MWFRPDGTFVRSDIWREGEYLDLWSVPHFLSGIALGCTLFFLGFDFRSSVAIAALLLIAYEMFEIIVDIHETPANRTLDVVVGLASCIPTLYYAPLFPFERVALAFALVLIADSILSFLGWRASQKAAELEVRLRTKWQAERLRMRERGQALKARIKRRPPLT
jgi:hypothetical protein